ncbi:Imm1 family immunity protein [Saccharothrix sp. HUAS TT1]|uniref:Imm1 family immunity protein n=1 Tax=unclassified Saccharothrix TaxID=2593673 RepID=UPI00345B5A5F
MGIDGDKGGLRYAGEDSPPADSEFPPHAELPVAELEAAVVDYLTTGRRPEGIEWQTAG